MNNTNIEMSSALDRMRKKAYSRSTDESFMNKPCSGWLHDESQLSRDAGVNYAIRVSEILE